MCYNISMNITILGAGAFGSALSEILEKNGHKIVFYSLEYDISLDDALKSADMVLLSVPSAAAPLLLKKLPHDLPLIVATKGLLDFDLFQDFKDIMFISGPSFAEDVKKQRPVQFTITDYRLKRLFAADFITFDETADERGVMLCGSLKNVYAIFAGLADLKPGSSDHEKYLTLVEKEMGAILAKNGAKKETASLYCGRGDLRITCGYPSRNYDFGQKKRQNHNYQPEQTVEGLTTLNLIKNYALVIPESAKILRKLMELSEKWA